MINQTTFKIGNTTGFKKFLRNGIAKQVKQTLSINFQPFAKNLIEPRFDTSIDPFIVDPELMLNRSLINLCFDCITQYSLQNNYKIPEPWNLAHAQRFYDIVILNVEQSVLKPFNLSGIDKIKNFEEIVLFFALTCAGVFPPLTAFIGGVVSQEIIKALTKKWTPINQVYIHSVSELLPSINIQAFLKK